MGKIVKGINDLATLFPDVAKQWDYEKNAPKRPEDFAAFSNKKMHWKCPKCDMPYLARISDRTAKNSGCPYCAGKIPIVGKNDLKSQFPLIAREWDYEKNAPKKPEDYTVGSDKKVHWICSECGHPFKMHIVNRTTRGDGCPECAKEKRVITRRTINIQNNGSFADRYPEYVKEWHPSLNKGKLPQDYEASSHELIWWKCSICGNKWKTTINSRTSRGSGCPECKKRTSTSFPEQAVYFYVKQIFPEAINRYLNQDSFELDIYLPGQKLAIEYDGEAWHKNLKKDKKKYESCKKNGITLVRIREDRNSVTTGIADFVIYSDYRQPKYHELDGVLQELFHYLHCSIQTNVEEDRFKIMETYYNDLERRSIAVLYPEIAAEWDYEKNGNLKPTMFSVSSNEKVNWICSKGHRWATSIDMRVRNNTSCPYCFEERRSEAVRQASLKPGINDLKTTYPEVAKTWCYEKNEKAPEDYTYGSKVKVYWNCEACGKPYPRIIKARTIGGQSGLCRYCSNKRKNNIHK